MPDIALSYQRAQRVIPTGVGIVPMDIVVNFSNGTGALTASKINAGTHGATWGAWQEYHGGGPDTPNTHAFIEEHGVRFPGIIRCAGADYTGQEGQGLTFDFNIGATSYDVFHMSIVPTITNAIAIYLINFATIVGDNSFNNDTFMFAGSTYSIAQFSHVFNDTKLIYAHSEGDLGGSMTVPDRWVIVCLFHNADGQLGEFFMQDAETLEVLGSSHSVHSIPAGSMIYIRLQSYLHSLTNSTGTIKIKMLAMRNSDLTWPPYLITVPVPTSVVAAQTDTDTITLTWGGYVAYHQIERNVDGGGWTVLEAAWEDNGNNTYVDATVSDGQSVQYRLTGTIGAQTSTAVLSNTVVVAN